MTMNTLMNNEVFNEPIKRNQNFLRLYGMNQTWVIQEKKKKKIQKLIVYFKLFFLRFFFFWSVDHF